MHAIRRSQRRCAVTSTTAHSPISPHTKKPTTLVLAAMAPARENSAPRRKPGCLRKRSPSHSVHKNSVSSTMSLLL